MAVALTRPDTFQFHYSLTHRSFHFCLPGNMAWSTIISLNSGPKNGTSGFLVTCNATKSQNPMSSELNCHLYPVEVVVKRVDNYQYITKFSRNDSSSIVSPVFSPHDVNLVIAWKRMSYIFLLCLFCLKYLPLFTVIILMSFFRKDMSTNLPRCLVFCSMLSSLVEGILVDTWNMVSRKLVA